MIMEKEQPKLRTDGLEILFWGAVWGIFEATVGYALHLLPWKIGAYIWFPAAYYFMDRVYESTHKRSAVVAVAIVSAAIKLLNLFSPMRPDYVINPAVSILLESLAMIYVLSVSKARESRAPLSAAAKVISINTLWRFMYTLYLAFLVPAWMREVSVTRDAGAYLSFILSENLISEIVCAAVLGAHRLVKNNMPGVRMAHSHGAARYVATGLLLCASVLLQFLF